jgi:PAS domain S-box-containing protein
MADKMNNTTSVAELRRKAEEKVASQLAFATSSQETDTKRLLHELQVHQVELEMQNEELRLAIVEKSEHEAHLRNIITQTPAGYFHIDLEGRFLNVNKAWLRMHGYDSPDEVIGKHFSMMQVDSESDSALIHLAELQRGVAIPYGEFSSRRKDGSVGHHIFSAHPVVNVSTIVGFEWFIIDISERRRSEEASRVNSDLLAEAHQMTKKSNELLSAILENMSDWIWEVDGEGRYTYCSNQAGMHLGYTPDEIIGKTPFDFMPPEEAERIGIQFMEICQGKLRIQNLENWNITKDGRRILLLTNGVPILGADGTLNGYRGVDRDITELRRYEAELRKLSRAVQQSPVTTVITDTFGSIEFVNPKFTELTGYTAEEAIGQNPLVDPLVKTIIC